jgi:hypothetical protein
MQSPNPYMNKSFSVKPKFSNKNPKTGKSYCVWCLKGLPKIKADERYANWTRLYHKGGACAESKDCASWGDGKYMREKINNNKALITKCIAENKIPIKVYEEERALKRKLLAEKKKAEEDAKKPDFSKYLLDTSSDED